MCLPGVCARLHQLLSVRLLLLCRARVLQAVLTSALQRKKNNEFAIHTQHIQHNTNRSKRIHQNGNYGNTTQTGFTSCELRHRETIVNQENSTELKRSYRQKTVEKRIGQEATEQKKQAAKK